MAGGVLDKGVPNKHLWKEAGCIKHKTCLETIALQLHKWKDDMELKTVLLLVLLLGLICSQAIAGFEVRTDQDDFISVFENDKPVLRYVRGEILREGVPEDRRRGTYVHPVYSLDGVELTEDFPESHHHHRGLSWMWQQVTFDGATKDLWHMKGLHQRYEEFRHETSKNSCRLDVKNHWVEDSTGSQIVSEKVSILIHPADTEGRIIDYRLELLALETPVAIDCSGAGYSGLTLRFAPREDTIISTSKGRVTEDEARKRYAWTDISAKFAGLDKYDGIAIFDHPKNPHYPSGWTLRNYGLLNPSFTANSGPHTLEPGKPLVLNYRLYVHRGIADEMKLHELFKDYRNLEQP